MALCEPCVILSKDNKATFKCTECEEVYCDKCADDHAKFRAFRQHRVRPLEPPDDNKASQSVILKSEGQTESKCRSDGVGLVKDAIAFDADADNLAVDIEKALKIRSKADAEATTTGNLVAEGNAINSGSAGLDAERKALYGGSSDLDVEDKQLYSGSDDLDVEDKQLYSGSDDLYAEKKALNCGSDNLAEDTATIYAASDALVVEEEHVYDDIDDANQSTYYYYTDVKESVVSRAIGIANSQCLLTVSKDKRSISMSKNGAIMFECQLNVLRRYGTSSAHEFYIEFGRRFQYGSGILSFNLKTPKALQTQFRAITHRTSNGK